MCKLSSAEVIIVLFDFVLLLPIRVINSTIQLYQWRNDGLKALYFGQYSLNNSQSALSAVVTP